MHREIRHRLYRIFHGEEIPENRPFLLEAFDHGSLSADIDQRAGRPPSESGGDMVVAVRILARESDKKISGLQGPAIDGKAPEGEPGRREL
jgi:hypothetical protein